MSDIFEIGRRAKAASRVLSTCSSATKSDALVAMAEALMRNSEEIIEANTQDLRRGVADGLADSMFDRLTLTPARIEDMASGLRTVADLPDPIGEVLSGWKRPNGLQISKVRVPLGVVGVIYEARPNVTVDVAGLCLKSGNAAVLRGSGSALESNRVLVKILDEAGTAAGLPADAIQLVDASNRDTAKEMMRLREYIDVLIPRGGAELIQTVVNESHVPVIETGVGNCHVYVDAQADLFKAIPVLVNAKVQRPSVCNSAETLIVHRGICTSFLPRAIKELTDRNVEVRGDERAQSVSELVRPATETDWRTEYLGLIIAVKVVDTIDEAIEHINKYGTGHTEAIITESVGAARKFAAEVDAACVMINASTRFADGGEFGFGAEIGISNQKLHARGPMGLAELTSYKYIVEGDGQVRS